MAETRMPIVMVLVALVGGAVAFLAAVAVWALVDELRARHF